MTFVHFLRHLSHICIGATSETRLDVKPVTIVSPPLQNMFDSVDIMESKLDSMSPVGTDLETVKQQIEELKVLMQTFPHTHDTLLYVSHSASRSKFRAIYLQSLSFLIV